MTIPGREEPRAGLTPARRGRDRGRPVPPEAPTTAADDADLQRGLAAAVLAAMGRTQLKLEAMSRQQAADIADLQARLQALDGRLAGLEALLPNRVAPADPTAASQPALGSDPLWGNLPDASRFGPT